MHTHAYTHTVGRAHMHAHTHTRTRACADTVAKYQSTRTGMTLFIFYIIILPHLQANNQHNSTKLIWSPWHPWQRGRVDAWLVSINNVLIWQQLKSLTKGLGFMCAKTTDSLWCAKHSIPVVYKVSSNQAYRHSMILHLQVRILLNRKGHRSCWSK